MRALAIIALVACGSHSDPKPAVADKPPTANAWGWWQVADVPGADDIRGGAMLLASDHMAIVSKDTKLVANRTCTTTVRDASVTITGCGPALTGTLAGDKLDFGTFTATRMPTARVAELDALAKGGADACDHARRCYRDAWPELGRKLAEDYDFGPGPSAETCANMLAGFADELRKAGKPLGACAP